jgi:hypothetical protein
MQRVMVHGDHAKEMIVVFSNGLAGPMTINIADNEIF